MRKLFEPFGTVLSLLHTFLLYFGYKREGGALMLQFKKIIFVSGKNFNENKPVDGYYPQDGIVINCFVNHNSLTNHVAVGFSTLKKEDK